MPMRHAQSSTRRRLPQLLGLGISAVALVGLVQLQSVWAQADRDADDLTAEELAEEAAEEAAEQEAAEQAPVVQAAPAPKSPSPAAAADTAPAKAEPAPMIAKAEVTVDAVADAAAAAETEAEIIPDTPALVAVPDLAKMGLRKARKQLKEAGLKLVARDGSYRISRDEYRYYRVRKQQVAPGTMVEPGTRIKVKARMRYSYAQGY